jgi:predicted Na+-dependent transporter
MQQILKSLNSWLLKQYVGVLLVMIGVSLLFPGAAIALRSWKLISVPHTRWSYDFPSFVLTLMILAASMNCSLSDFRQLGGNPRPGLASLAMIYAVIPAFTAVVGLLLSTLFRGDTAAQVRIGLLLIALVPVANTACMWAQQAEGNMALLLSLIALSSGLVTVALPLYLKILAEGNAGFGMPSSTLIACEITSVTIPLLAGLLLKMKFPGFARKCQPFFSLLGCAGAIASIASNSAALVPKLLLDGSVFAGIVAVTLFYNLAAFALSIALSRFLKLNREDTVVLVFGASMRSTANSVVVGIKGFPQMPLVTAPATIYSISQHVIASHVVKLMAKRRSAVEFDVLPDVPVSFDSVENGALETSLG